MKTILNMFLVLLMIIVIFFLAILCSAKIARAEDVVPSPKVLVRMYFPNNPVMRAVAKAESKFIPTADNPISTADGIYQIIDGTWDSLKCEGDKKDAEDNIKCAAKLYAKNGTRDWNASKANWSYATRL